MDNYNNINVSNGEIIAGDLKPYMRREDKWLAKFYYQDAVGKEIAISAISDGETNFYNVDPVADFTNYNGFSESGSSKFQFDGGIESNDILTGEDYSFTAIVKAGISYSSTHEKDQVAFKLIVEDSGGTPTDYSKVYDVTAKANGIHSLCLEDVITLTLGDKIYIKCANMSDTHNLTIYQLTFFIHG